MMFNLFDLMGQQPIGFGEISYSTDYNALSLIPKLHQYISALSFFDYISDYKDLEPIYKYIEVVDASFFETMFKIWSTDLSDRSDELHNSAFRQLHQNYKKYLNEIVIKNIIHYKYRCSRTNIRTVAFIFFLVRFCNLLFFFIIFIPAFMFFFVLSISH